MGILADMAPNVASKISGSIYKPEKARKSLLYEETKEDKYTKFGHGISFFLCEEF